MFSLRSCGKINEGVTSPSLVTTQIPWCGLGVWFYHNRYISRQQRLFGVFTIWSWQKFFLLEKNQRIFDWWGFFSLFKSLAASSFLLWYLVIKIVPVSSCMKNTKCFHAQLPDKKLRHWHISDFIDLIDLLRSLSFMAWISPINSGWDFRAAVPL